LRETLAAENKVGISKVVIKTKQYLAAVKPTGNALLLELMHFADELVQPENLQLPKGIEIRKAEKDMAKQLIHQMSDKWEPKKYKDDYREAVMKLIEEKAAHPGETPKAAPKPKRESKVIDLAEVLKRSLAETQKKSRSKKEPVKLKKAA
jgi:DNA end-binding protein Ku